MLPADAGRITVGEFLRSWLTTIEPAVKPKTFQQYGDVVRLHLAPMLGNLKLADLRPDHLQHLYAVKLKTLSPRSVQLCHSIARRALNDALRWGLVNRNVCLAVTAPKPQRPELQVWTPEQARAFLEGIAGDRLEALYRLALACGPRVGEILGLRWEDVDLIKGRIQIRRTLQRIRRKGVVVGEPKSGKGRQIALPTAAANALRRWKKRQLQDKLLAGRRWQDTGYLFTSSVGSPIEHRNLIRDFHAKTEALGLPYIRFHDLRHTAATLLLSQGVHPKLVQEMLGHSQISLTMDIYSHVLPDMQDEVARIMDRLLP